MSGAKNFRKTKKGIITNAFQKQKIRHSVYYSLSELHDKFLVDFRFNRLFNEWVKSGYKKDFIPTIDRINCKKGYGLDNVHCLTWAENMYKSRMEIRFKRNRKIVSLKDGVVVQKYRSVAEAVRKTGVSQGNLSSCLNGKSKTCGKLNWEYET